jgi:hypothetical protein
MTPLRYSIQQEFNDFLQHGCVHGVLHERALPLTDDQVRRTEHSKVPRDRRPATGESLGDLT